MKKLLMGSLLLGVSLVVATPAFADHKHYERYQTRDRYETGSGKLYESRKRHDNSHHAISNHFESRYKHAYHSGHAHGKHDRSVIRRYRYIQHHYGHNDGWYKWTPGTYLASELIHHFHDGRVCHLYH